MSNELSICQMLSESDCIAALASGTCPNEDTCKGCLYRERFDRDDANWTPKEATAWRP